MSPDDTKRIGLLIGREKDLPNAFIAALNARNANAQAEMVQIGGTRAEDTCPYNVIIDRMSHEIPYYRTYVKFAAMRGCYIINDPFVWASDSRFFGSAVADKLGLLSPRTIVLPNKDVEADVVPDSFRNLVYPMDWEGIIEYVGVPAIFKEVRSGGRRFSARVHSVDDLIQRYDESGTLTMILQELIENGEDVHSFVIGNEHVLTLRYSNEEKRYLDDDSFIDTDARERLAQSALAITRAYGYDINMIEFMLKDGDVYVINSTNPSPLIDRQLLSAAHFDWLVEKTVDLALERAQRPLPQRITFHFEGDAEA